MWQKLVNPRQADRRGEEARHRVVMEDQGRREVSGWVRRFSWFSSAWHLLARHVLDKGGSKMNWIWYQAQLQWLTWIPSQPSSFLPSMLISTSSPFQSWCFFISHHPDLTCPSRIIPRSPVSWSSAQSLCPNFSVFRAAAATAINWYELKEDDRSLKNRHKTGCKGKAQAQGSNTSSATTQSWEVTHLVWASVVLKLGVLLPTYLWGQLWGASA